MVLINGKIFELIAVHIHSNQWRQKLNHKITYHVQNKSGEGCHVLEEMITKKIGRAK